MLSALAGACSNDRERAAPSQPYEAELEAARDNATSDLERDILEDLSIDRAEFEEAVNAYITCMNDRGVSVEAIEQAGYFIYHTTGDRNDAADVDCREGTIAQIEPIYVDLVRNPDRLPVAELLRNCLVRRGVVDSSYSANDFDADRRTGFESAPYDPEDERVGLCLANPSQ